MYWKCIHLQLVHNILPLFRTYKCLPFIPPTSPCLHLLVTLLFYSLIFSSWFALHRSSCISLFLYTFHRFFILFIFILFIFILYLYYLYLYLYYSLLSSSFSVYCKCIVVLANFKFWPYFGVLYFVPHDHSFFCTKIFHPKILWCVCYLSWHVFESIGLYTILNTVTIFSLIFIFY